MGVMKFDFSTVSPLKQLNYVNHVIVSVGTKQDSRQ